MSRIIAAAVAMVVAGVASAVAQVPSGYPADYAKVIEAANREGRLIVYSTTDSAAAAQLLRDFAGALSAVAGRLLRVEFRGALQPVPRRARRRRRHRRPLWASAMDGQVKLAYSGLATAYASPELPSLPTWAVWHNQAYGTTYEPITFVYNRRLVPAADVPQDHAALLRLLNGKGDAYKGSITAYDPEKFGTGYLLANQDTRNFPEAWELFQAFGRSAIRLPPRRPT